MKKRKRTLLNYYIKNVIKREDLSIQDQYDIANLLLVSNDNKKDGEAYTRKLISLELALKEIIKNLKEEGLKKATNKSESHFRKCSDENDKDHNIHHKDSIAIDLECIKKGWAPPC